MRDLRRDETWLADYTARTQSVHQRWKDREVQSTSGRTAVATSLPQSHDAGSPGPLTQSTSGGVEKQARLNNLDDGRSMPDENHGYASRPKGVLRGTRAGVAPGPLVPIAPVADAATRKGAEARDLARLITSVAGATPIATCADAASDHNSLAHAPPLTGTHPRQVATTNEQRAKANAIVAHASHPGHTLAGRAASSPSNKYRNIKTGGYASKKEAKRAAELRLLEQGCEISNLREQVPYVLIPRQLDADGSVAERAVTYIADFVYHDRYNSCMVIEDCKGVRTPDYIIKRKLMRFTHGIVIKET